MKALLSFLSRGRVSPRRATHFLLLRQKKVSKEKATLLSASLRFAAGNLRCSRFAGSRRTRFAQTAASPDPRNAALLGAARREWIPNAPSLRSASARAFTSLGAQDTPGRRFVRRGNCQQHPTTNSRQTRPACLPFGPSEAMARVVSTPLWLRRGAERFADQGRSCLSEASSADPAKREHRRLPRSEAQGSQTVGSPFFCLPFFGEAKKSRSPAGARPGLGKQIQKSVQPAGAGR
ncbi:hypothetical protein J2W23_002998 [Variovorax boronicumulans]|nr:hypothetical protein [Variovorax boronicumulans]